MDEIRKEAEARHLLHIGHPTHRPLSDGYELVGLRGEEALADYFGLSIDMVRRPAGDGGRDNVLVLSGQQYVVDVKTARLAFNLIVERGKVRPRTIYILARYDDALDKAFLVGWEWGLLLLRAPVKDFGYGVMNHFIHRDRLRSLDELACRVSR